MRIAVVTEPKAPLMFAMADSSSQLATVLQDESVEVIEIINELWWKVKYNEHTGYIRSNFLKGENFDGEITVTVDIPKDSAAELYKALKSALNK